MDAENGAIVLDRQPAPNAVDEAFRAAAVEQSASNAVDEANEAAAVKQPALNAVDEAIKAVAVKESASNAVDEASEAAAVERSASKAVDEAIRATAVEQSASNPVDEANEAAAAERPAPNAVDGGNNQPGENAVDVMVAKFRAKGEDDELGEDEERNAAAHQPKKEHRAALHCQTFQHDSLTRTRFLQCRMSNSLLSRKKSSRS